MAKYRKKAVVIEAIKVSDLGSDLTGAVPYWMIKAMIDGVVYTDSEGVKIKTLEGDMLAGADDYIIQGVKGELYPCKPDIFRLTYEWVDPDDAPPLTKEWFDKAEIRNGDRN